MKRIRYALLSCILVAGLSGCILRQNEPRHSHTVFLIDVSASIDKAAEEAAFDAVIQAVKSLHRGDSVSVIPITGDAETEAQGRIMRFRVPTVREAYDQDLKRFAESVRASLTQAKAAAVASPGAKTDILGSIDLAFQEFAVDPANAEQSLIVLSDFIQDDSTMNFNKDPALADSGKSKLLAERLLHEKQLPRLSRVFLGTLRSSDLMRLDRKRRKAIEAFWMRYCSALSAAPVFAVDGPALMGEFMGTNADTR
jgi:hypothetical protein